MDKQPCYVHCKDCNHQWAAFYFPLDLDNAGMNLLKAVSKTPCPMCASKKVFMGETPTLQEQPQ